MDFFRRHPILGIVLAIVLVYLLFRMLSGGGGNAQTGVVYTGAQSDPNAIAAATALQQSQLAASSSAEQGRLQLEGQNAQIAGAVTVAQLQQQLGMSQLAYGAQAETQKTQAAVDVAAMQAQSANLASTLAAQVSAAGLNAQVQVANIGANVTNTQTLAMQNMNAQNASTTQAIVASQGQTQVQLAKVNKKWCFITTAACEAHGLPDDCYVLDTLRAWRDGWLTQNVPAEIARYYALAPGIVARFDVHPSKALIYDAMWNDFIMPALYCVERGQNRAAFAIYASMFETFKVIAAQGVAEQPHHGKIVDVTGKLMLRADNAA